MENQRNVDFFYKDWQEQIGSRLEKRRKYFENILMPGDSLIKIIKDFSLGNLISRIKDYPQDQEEISVENLISLYSLEKKLNNNNGKKSKAEEMKNNMEIYFKEDLELLGFQVKDDKLELAFPEKIGNVESLKKLSENISGFADEFRDYVSYLEKKAEPFLNEINDKIKNYDDKKKHYKNIAKKIEKTRKSCRRRKYERKIYKLKNDQNQLEKEKKKYDLIFQRINSSIETHEKDMQDNLKNIINHLEADSVIKYREKESFRSYA